MAEQGSSLKKRNAELVARIYAGALNPAEYSRIFEAWDAHLKAMEENEAFLEADNFDWTEEFVRHFEQAGIILDRVSKTETHDLKSYTERFAHPAMICSTSGKIEYLNKHATNLLNGPPPSSVFDLPMDGGSEVALTDFVQQSLDDCSKESSKSCLVRVYLGDVEEPHFFVATKIPSGLIDGEETNQKSQILLKSVNGVWTLDIEDVLSVAFELTSAELSLISALYKGMTIKEIANSTGRSQATLRTQLSSALQKTGAKNQSALSRMVAGLVHVVEQEEMQRNDASRVVRVVKRVNQNSAVLELDNGFVLEYFESGCLEGAPFYFIQPTTTPTLTPDIVAALEKRRIRLISPVRSGVGLTTKTPTTFGVSDWAAIHLEALEQLGIAEFACGGHCSGGIYALELARQAGQRCKGVLLADTGAPLSHIGMIYSMEPAPRRLFLAARYFPRAISTPIRLVAADFFSGIEGEKRGVNYFFEGSPADLAILHQGQNWRLTRDNLEYCFRNAGQLAQDIRIWSQNSLPLLRQTSNHCPVHFLHGQENLVHKAENIRKLCVSNEKLSFNIVEGAAQLLIYIKPEIFADEVAKLA